MDNYIWFISDLHFNHELMYKIRKFKTLKDMNKFLSYRMYKRDIGVNDILYHVGDLSLGKNKLTWKSNMPRNTIYIKGNHDSLSLSNIKSQVILWKGKSIEIIHDPLEASGKNDIVIHGHVHKTGHREMPKGAVQHKPYIHNIGNVYYYNVNCEFHKYKLKLLNEIVGEIEHLKNG